MNNLQTEAQPSLYYLTRQPKTETVSPPLLILLHGIGSNEEDLFSFANKLPDNFLVISVRAPLTIAQGSYAWYQIELSYGTTTINIGQAEESRIAIIQFIEDLKRKFSFDASRVYLAGFSQGGIMSYSAGLTRPDLIHGIAVMSGRLLEEVKPKISKKENLKDLRVFISHGTADNTLNIQYARLAKTFLQSSGINPDYHEYSEGHTINPEMFADLLKWLKE